MDVDDLRELTDNDPEMEEELQQYGRRVWVMFSELPKNVAR